MDEHLRLVTLWWTFKSTFLAAPQPRVMTHIGGSRGQAGTSLPGRTSAPPEIVFGAHLMGFGSPSDYYTPPPSEILDHPMITQTAAAYLLVSPHITGGRHFLETPK